MHATIIQVPEKHPDVVPLFAPQRLVSYLRIIENGEEYFLLLPAEMPVTVAREMAHRINRGRKT